MRARRSWPAVRIEQRPWRTNPDLRGPTGTRPSRADRMLDRIEVEVPAEIRDRRLDLESATVAACEAAAQAIGSVEARAEHLEGLGELLVRTEAVASSKIEHVYADVDDIARASLGSEATERARRTVAASQAMGELTGSVDAGGSLTEGAVLRAHQALLADDPMERQFAGRYREQQNWIGGSDFTPRGAVHVPPPHDLVKSLMADLVAFGNRNDVAAIGQAAILHAQFEAIHPFTDGNGRVGRALIGAALRRRAVTRRVTVPVAGAMLADVDRYFDLLKSYRGGDADAVVRYVAESAIAASEAAAASAEVLAQLPARWHEVVGARRGSSSHRLIEHLVRTPVLDIARATEMTGSTRIRTYEAIDRLAEAGVLHEITGRGRNRIWVADDVMTELGELEERIGLRAKPSTRWR